MIDAALFAMYSGLKHIIRTISFKLFTIHSQSLLYSILPCDLIDTWENYLHCGCTTFMYCRLLLFIKLSPVPTVVPTHHISTGGRTTVLTTVHEDKWSKIILPIQAWNYGSFASVMNFLLFYLSTDTIIVVAY